jgi:hypothetical protein
LQSNDPLAAQTLCTLGLRLAAYPTTPYERVFWCVASAFFELFGCGAEVLDAPFKRLIGQIVLHAHQLGAVSGARATPTNEALLRQLLLVCLRTLVVRHQQNTWPTDKVTPALDAIRHAANAANAAEEPALVPNPDAAPSEPAIKVIGDLRIQAADFGLYLTQADEYLRDLLTALNEWALEPQRPLPKGALGWVHALAQSTRRIGFVALADLAQTLELAMHHVQAHTPPANPAWTQLFVRSAEELRHLLHQFAAGFIKTPKPSLTAALQALLQQRYTLSTEAFHSALASALQQLDGALRQWVARPDNHSARAEVLRVLQKIVLDAQAADKPTWGVAAQAMVTQINVLGNALLEAAQGTSLLMQLAQLQAELGRLQNSRSLLHTK